MYQSIKPAKTLPGNFGLPFIGEAMELLSTQQLYYWKRFQRYGPIFKTRIMGRKIVVLAGPDASQTIFKDQAEKLSSRMGWSFLEPLIGKGILLQDGHEHRISRRLMYPAFHGQAIASYFSTIQNTVEGFFQGWDERSPSFIADDFRKLTLLVACRLLLGTQADQDIKKLSYWFLEFYEGIRTVIRLNTPLTKFGRALSARRELETFIHSVITQRRRKGILEESQDVLGLLLATTDEEGNCLSNSEVITQTLQLLFGGHETTAKLLCWSLFELAAHPQWIVRLRTEQNQIIGSDAFAVSHLRNLTQMSYLLKEIERLYPPLYSIPRGVVEDIEYGGYCIPAGWFVIVSSLLTHRMSQLYTEPDNFDPERFAPPREEHKKHPFALIGFGGGPHKCLGYEFAQMEMKIILSTLLRHFDWSITPDPSSIAPVRQQYKVERTLQAKVKRRHVNTSIHFVASKV